MGLKLWWLARKLRSASEGDRCTAARELGGAGVGAVPLLLEGCADAAPAVREECGRSLNRLNSPAALDPLLAGLRHANEEVRAMAVQLLGRHASALDSILAALGDPSKEVRHRAAKALRILRDARAVPALIAALQDPEEWVRRAAVGALGALKDGRALPALAALRSSDENMVAAAASALRECDDPRALSAAAELAAARLARQGKCEATSPRYWMETLERCLGRAPLLTAPALQTAADLPDQLSYWYEYVEFNLHTDREIPTRETESFTIDCRGAKRLARDELDRRRHAGRGTGMTRVTCPCGAHLRVTAEQVGRRLKCPKCRRDFTVAS